MLHIFQRPLHPKGNKLFRDGGGGREGGGDRGQGGPNRFPLASSVNQQRQDWSSSGQGGGSNRGEGHGGGGWSSGGGVERCVLL